MYPQYLVVLNVESIECVRNRAVCRNIIRCFYDNSLFSDLALHAFMCTNRMSMRLGHNQMILTINVIKWDIVSQLHHLHKGLCSYF